jgi:uncharacterized membrane protein YoaK (UPF0700 family)
MKRLSTLISFMLPLVVLTLLSMSVVALILLVMPNVAIAQVIAPVPTPPVTNTLPTTPVIVVTLLALALGYINQGISQGSILGIVTVPRTWLPYLTLIASFLGGAVTSLSQASAINGATVWYAAIAGFSALLAAGTGSALNHHVGTPARTLKAQAAAKAATDAPAADTKPSS